VIANPPGICSRCKSPLHNGRCPMATPETMEDTIDRLAAENEALRRELASLRSHYDRAAPEHNLLALLDLFMEREHEAERQRDEYKRLYFAAIDERDDERDENDSLRATVARVMPVYEAARVLWQCRYAYRVDLVRRNAENALMAAADAAFTEEENAAND
jgi:hypothetical protein